MRFVLRLTMLVACFGLLGLLGAAQEPRDDPGDAPKRPAKKTPAGSSVADSIVSRMMAFDKNKDGKLSRDEISDSRLLRLFDRADKNKDGVVTKEELTALAKQMADEQAANGERRGGFGPPGGPGGPGGPRGPGGPGGPPRPGLLLPPFLQEQLQLSDKQKEQLEELQREVDRKLDKILTAAQKKQLQEMRPRGPGGPGGRGPGERGPGDGPPQR